MREHADICLILEGTYPFVTGGVSHWVHELISEQSHLSFHLMAIVPADAELELKYKLPANIKSLKVVRLGQLPDGADGSESAARNLHQQLHDPLLQITGEAPLELEQLKRIINAFRASRIKLGSALLLDHEAAWKQLVDVYQERFDEHSFLDFFWSYRAIVSGIYSVLLAELPSADIYHALSTGYAGLTAARAKIETGKAAMVTEHGIYTNERRIEVVSADWLEATASKSLTIDKPRRDLRDLWIDSINNFSQVCYQACDEIITLFKGNQVTQIEDGADPTKLRIIPNGVDIAHYGSIKRQRSSEPTLALIGRVVPIKDIKTYIRSVALLRQYSPDIKAYVIGPTDENPSYYQECRTMAALLGVEENVVFTGRVNIDEYLEYIDLLVLTSLSEAQPLVMQEAGACGIPLIATDVGACRELIEGTDQEEAIGSGGIVVPLANPAAVAEAVRRLLGDEALYQRASAAIKKRMQNYYDLSTHQQTYRDLYARYLGR